MNIILFLVSAYFWILSRCLIRGELGIFETTQSIAKGYSILLIVLLIWELLNFGLYKILGMYFKATKMYIAIPMLIILILNSFVIFFFI